MRHKLARNVWYLTIAVFAYATITTPTWTFAVIFAIVCAGMCAITVAVKMEHRAQRLDDIERARAYADRIGSLPQSLSTAPWRDQPHGMTREGKSARTVSLSAPVGITRSRDCGDMR